MSFRLIISSFPRFLFLSEFWRLLTQGVPTIFVSHLPVVTEASSIREHSCRHFTLRSIVVIIESADSSHPSLFTSPHRSFSTVLLPLPSFSALVLP